MKFKVRKNQIIKALQKIQGVATTSSTLTILSHVLLEATETELFVMANDLEVGIKTKCSAKVVTAGKVTVPAKNLYRIVKELPDQLIIFSADDNCSLEVECGDIQFTLNSEPACNYPLFPVVLEEALMEFDAPMLADMIDKTKSAICHDEQKYNLNGVFTKHTVHPDGSDCIEMVATDAKWLVSTYSSFSGGIYSKLDDGIIIPTKGVIELKKLANEYDGELRYCFVENSIVFKNHTTILAIRLIDGVFPEYKQCIPNYAPAVAVVDKEPLTRCLHRMMVHSGNKHAGLKFELSINNLLIAWSDIEKGDITERISVDYAGDDITVRFNATFLTEALAGIETKQVNMSFYGSHLLYLAPMKSDSYLSLVMAMKL